MNQAASITHLLKKAGKGDTSVYEQLMPKIYDQLKALAYNNLAKEYRNHTYSKTELVHEAYLKLIKYDHIDWKNRVHFYAIASKCMRQILIDHARKKIAEKRGGDQHELTFVDTYMKEKEQASELIDLDSALKELEALDERMAQIVEYRYFGEMNIEDTAEAMDLSPSTVKREWAKARGWLYKRLKSKFS
jgi:RNA polymerase sigma factor (TIGR02999 family)